MDRRAYRPILVTAVVLLLIVPILIVAGLFVRGYVRNAFDTGERVRAVRVAAFEALKLQLDEETGIRGFAATHDRRFLEPYDEARGKLGPALQRLEDGVRGAGEERVAGMVADARAASRLWNAQVAEPLSAARPASPLLVQRRGKVLMDRYRADLEGVDAALAARESSLDGEAEGAIARITAFVLVATILLAILASAYGVQQTRLARRLAQREREGADLRVAYETEKRIADALQDAFLQRPLPAVPTVAFSATYVPATEEAKVGGDWYDGVELSPDRVMFAIGDVAGHGIDAAVAMNRARQAMVSAAVLDADPARVLARVNRELLQQESRMVTAVCGYADSQSYEFVYAAAGHPPPVLIEPGRPPRMLACGSLPLGVLADAPYATASVQTVPGAMLVLYTDGAVEHSRDVLDGERVLLEAVAHAVEHEPHDVAAAVHRTIFDGRDAGDDVAILTVTFAANRAAEDDVDGRRAIVATGARGTSGGVGGTVVSLVERVRPRPRRRDAPGRIAS